MTNEVYRVGEFERVFGVTPPELRSQGIDVDMYVVKHLRTIKNKYSRQNSINRLFYDVSPSARFRYMFVVWLWRTFKLVWLLPIMALLLSITASGLVRFLLVVFTIADLSCIAITYVTSMYFFIRHLREHYRLRPKEVGRFRWFLQTGQDSGRRSQFGSSLSL